MGRAGKLAVSSGGDTGAPSRARGPGGSGQDPGGARLARARRLRGGLRGRSSLPCTGGPGVRPPATRGREKGMEAPRGGSARIRAPTSREPDSSGRFCSVEQN